jgi:acyl-CoA synthetase (NDP forming)
MTTTAELLKSYEPLFNPRSIAVVGASNVPGKWGFGLPLNLVHGGYEGDLFYINPHEKYIHGYKAYPDLKSVPSSIDLAIVTVPAKACFSVLDECEQKGTRNIVMISAGFSETGASGRELEDRLVEQANRAGIRIIGPNMMGICCPPNRLLAIGAPVNPPPGHISFLSQSGNLGVQLLGWADRAGLGIARFVNSGNEAQTTCDQILEYYGADPMTRVIIFYLEGIDRGERFLELAERISRHKPIIALKVGVTEAGAKAAQSHSGAVSTSSRVYQAMVRQAGIIEAESTEELIDLARTFGNLPIPRGRHVGIMTMGGGWGVVTTDLCAREGLELPDISPETLARIDRVLPRFWSRSNPVDLVGTINRAAHFEVMEALVQDPRFDSIITLGSLTGVRIPLRHALREAGIHIYHIFKRYKLKTLRLYHSIIWKGVRRSLKGSGVGGTEKSGGINIRERRMWRDDVFVDRVKSLMRASAKPIVPVAFDSSAVPEIFRRFGLVAFGIPEKAVVALAKLSDYGAYLERKRLEDEREVPELDCGDVSKLAEMYLSRKSGPLSESESKEILKIYGISTTAQELVNSPEEALKAAERIGYPVVLKVDSPDILHKSDAGVVKLDLKSADEIRRGYDEVMKAARGYKPEARINGVLVQEMVKGGTEVIVGVSRDEHFGQTILVGLGGIFVEVLEDVSIRILPIERPDAEAMIEEIQGRKLLEGFRGRPPGDKQALVEVLVRVGRLAYHHREKIQEMDINPLLVFEHGKGVKALDALVVLKS